jgi:hypothetical protein
MSRVASRRNRQQQQWIGKKLRLRSDVQGNGWGNSGSKWLVAYSTGWAISRCAFVWCSWSRV